MSNYYHPYSRTQTRFLRNDPTGRFCQIEDDDDAILTSQQAVTALTFLCALMAAGAIAAVIWRLM